MNIIGEGFPDQIIKQVNIRQNSHYLGYDDGRISSSHLYKNANTAWCRLVSATDIINPKKLVNTNISNLGYTENSLARNFVLFNGTQPIFSNEEDLIEYNTSSGVGFGEKGNLLKPHAYTSWGKVFSNADFGFRPMAGITSAKIRHLNNGSIRVANVNIKAWDKMSFEIIDVLYLRPGFFILLEWGHSMYYDNNGDFKYNPYNNDLMEEFLQGNVSYKTFLNLIQQKRLDTCGNYDALLGRINNYHWSIQPDGSYDITVDITSVGSTVESFKIKGNTPSNLTPIVVDNDPAIPRIDKLLDYYKGNNIVDYLAEKRNSLLSVGYSPSGINTAWLFLDKPRPYVYTNSNKDGEVVAMYPYYDTGNVTFNYFIRLGDLLNFIQNKVLYKISNSNNESQFLYIDTDTDTNLMSAPDQLMSYDPRVCMVRRKIIYPVPINEYKPSSPTSDLSNFNGNGWVYDKNSGNMSAQPDATTTNNIVIDPIVSNSTNADPNNTSSSNTNPPISTLEKVSESDEIFAYPYADADYTDTTLINKFMDDSLPEVGRIMNIYINYEFIISKLNELTNSDTNSVDLYSFLKELVSNINGAMGGFPKLDLWIDESTNTLKIIDQNPLPSNLSALKRVSKNFNTATFDVMGYHKKTETAGFIRDLKFTTEFNPNYSTMLTVSAANQGTAVTENNTALSKLNNGLIDKFKKEINGGGNSLVESNNSQDDYNNYLIAKKEYEDYLTQLERFLSDLRYNIYINDEIEANKSKYTIFLQLYKKYEQTKSVYEKSSNNKSSAISNTKFQPGTGFIPFNLTLILDGLSGMNIRNRFNIDSSFFPSNYPEILDFILKSVNHEIKDNQWITTLESFTVAQSNLDSRIKTIEGSKKLTPPKQKVKIKKIEEPPKEKEIKETNPILSDADLEKKLKKFNFHKIPNQTGSGNNNYRSAQLTEDLIPYVIKKYGIKNFVRYNYDDSDASDHGEPPTNRNVEKKLCGENNCNYYKYSAGNVTEHQKTNDLLNQGNTLIHCAHGADRTGVGVGAWILSKGFSKQEVWNYTVQYNGWQNLNFYSNGKFVKGLTKMLKSAWNIKDADEINALQKNKSAPIPKLK